MDLYFYFIVDFEVFPIITIDSDVNKLITYFGLVRSLLPACAIVILAIICWYNYVII